MKKYSTTESAAVPGPTRSKLYWVLVAWIVVVAGLDVITSSTNLPKGIRMYTIQANSMKPVISAGDLVITKPEEKYQLKQIISFEFPGNQLLVTHRIVNISYQNKQTRYITKGDNNTVVDHRLIPSENIFGRVRVIIPFLGFFIRFLESNLGLALLIIVPATLVVRKELLFLWKELKKRS